MILIRPAGKRQYFERHQQLMDTVENQRANRYSAKNIAKPINFYCVAPGAKSVSLVGDFNQWDRTANAMSRQVDGSWFVQVPLCHGHHRYVFMVDGKPRLDPNATGVTHNKADEEVSLIAVS